MKYFLFSIVPAAALFLFPVQIDPLPIGSPIPKPGVKMKAVSGGDFSLAELKTEKGLLVMFSCNTCPYVIKNEERTREICNYVLEKGIGVALLNSNEAYRDGDDSFAQMASYATAQGYNWHYLVDQNAELADAFGAKRTPECFLFDSGGKLVYHGAIDDNPSDASAVSRKHLHLAIDEMNSGLEVSTKETKSVGCTIKRL